MMNRFIPIMLSVFTTVGCSQERAREPEDPTHATKLNGGTALDAAGGGRESEDGSPAPELKADCDSWNTAEFFRRATGADVTRCLDQGIEVNARTDPWPESRTPLHLAAEFGNPSSISALIEAGAEIEARASYGESGGPFGDGTNKTALWVAVVWGTTANAKALTEADASIEEDIMYWTAGRGSPGDLQVLIEAGADIDNALFAAVYGGPANIAVLLAAGAEHRSRDAFGNTPLHAAADTESWEDGTTAAGSIRALLEAGADIEARNADGSTPLHVAAGCCSGPASVRALVEAGADIEARDAAGRTPLHVAVMMRYDGLESGDIGSLRALIEAGADLEALDEEGQTPLHVAALHPEAEWGQPGSGTKIGVLLAAGADIEARNRKGRTPLHVAAGIEHGGWESDYLSILLEAGASVERTDEDGLIPLDLAAGVATDVSGRADNVVKLLLAPLLFADRSTEASEGGDSAITTSTGWRVVVADGMGAAARGGRTVVLFADEEEIREGHPEPQGSWNRILSTVGSIVSIEHSYYYEGGAHPSYGATWETIDLETGEPSNLAAIFPEDEILAALRADLVVREAYRSGEEPGSLPELIDNLDGGCDMWFSRDMLADFAFHHVRDNRVAVRIGLTHGCEVMRGNFTQLGVYLDIPPALSEALDRASVDGWLMEARENR